MKKRVILPKGKNLDVIINTGNYQTATGNKVKLLKKLPRRRSLSNKDPDADDKNYFKITTTNVK